MMITERLSGILDTAHERQVGTKGVGETRIDWLGEDDVRRGVWTEV